MRYCVFSDIHSNWEAFESVSKAFVHDRIDEHLYIGDLIGYGADPHACITGLRLLNPGVLIAGNHEWGVLELLDLDYFNEHAGESIVWTRRMLNKAETEYLKSFTLNYESDEYTLVHGSLEKPARFNYILDKEDALLTLKLSRTQLCFVGHSHNPGFYSLKHGNVTYSRGPLLRIEEGTKYVVNVGSVGQPRDGNPKASYVIYDNRQKTIEIKRVAYNISAAQQKIVKAGLPAWLAARLAEGR